MNNTSYKTFILIKNKGLNIYNFLRSIKNRKYIYNIDFVTINEFSKDKIKTI